MVRVCGGHGEGVGDMVRVWGHGEDVDDMVRVWGHGEAVE